MHLSSLFQTAFVFFLILDPLGIVPIFITAVKSFEPKRQKEIIFRELVIALGIMLLFFFFGHALLNVIAVDTASLMVAGGIILFLIAVDMVFSEPSPPSERIQLREPMIVPLAIPAFAGPGILTAISLYSASASSRIEVLIAIVIAWVVSVPFLVGAPYFRKLLKDKGLIAVERLMGFIVILLSVDMLIKGVVLGLAS
ncbi:MAG: MarC family protein [Chlamydiia bacterium]|nr:MarC family protein [Chlamydiia bacterium]